MFSIQTIVINIWLSERDNDIWTCQNEINPTITTALRTIISQILHDMRKLKYEKKSNLWRHTDFWGVMQNTAASLFLNDM